MKGWGRRPHLAEVADKVGKVWGLGWERPRTGTLGGEQRNMWKPTQQEALWFHGGNLHQSRHYSLIWPCSSRPGKWASRRRSMACRRCIT